MHQCKSIYIDKIVMNNQDKIKSKSKSTDYIDLSILSLLENYVFYLVLIKVDLKDITLSLL